MVNDYGSSLDISKEIEADRRISENLKQAGSKKKQDSKHRPKTKQSPVSGLSFNWQAAIFIAILIFITVFTRLETADMPYFDAKAESVVDESIKNNVMLQVAQAKDLLPQEKSKAAEEQYIKAINDPRRDELIETFADGYKQAYRDDTGLNYFYGADAYHYYRLIKVLVEDGSNPGHKFPAVYAAFSKIITFFNSSIPLERSIFYLPVFFGTLSIILLFFITRRITDDIGGFFAALFFALNPSFLLNTRAGFIDTNSLNMLLSMIIICLLIHTIELKKKSIYTGILIIPCVWAFSKIWTGWYYIVFVIAAYVIILILVFMFMKAVRDRSIKWKSLLFIAIASSSSIAYYFINSGYMKHILARLKFTQGFFPSGFVAVAELQGYSFRMLSSRLGGYAVVFFVLCVLGFIAWNIFKELKAYGKKDITFRRISDQFNYRLFILIYFFSLAFVPFFAKRFTTYFVPAFCIALGIGLYYVLPYAGRFLRSISLNIKPGYIKACFVIIVSALLILSVQAALKQNMRTIPHMNDAIYNTALAIKYNSSSNAKINLWWDYGYLYQAIAERDVAFHGGSFESSRLHWITKALITDDENLSAGILRMLNCNAENTANRILSKEIGSTDAIYMLHKILPMTKQEAELFIKDNNLPDKLTQFTHCKSPESFLVVGDELERKVFVLNYYANFDFKKNNDKLEIKDMDYEDALEHFMDKHNMSRKQAVKYNSQLTGYDPLEIPPVQFKSKTDKCPQKEGNLICANDFVVNLSTMDISYNSMHPQAFIFYNGTLIRKDYDDAKMKYTAVVIGNNDHHSIFLLNPEFDRSMLFRMLYLEGNGLDKFELFNIEKNPQKVIAYKILV